uniref:Uncharacterized protein n=1 Tax=Arion vulgaris TaxID=1028688 RepID=A0A0B7AMU6_9EUPU
MNDALRAAKYKEHVESKKLQCATRHEENSVSNSSEQVYYLIQALLYENIFKK